MANQTTYKYVAYNESGTLVKGKISAASEEAASELLDFAGYQPVNLKIHRPFINSGILSDSLFPVKPESITLLYRQLSMLLESGTNITTALELLQSQTDNRTLKKILGEIISEIRGGSQLSKALLKYPKVFEPVYCQLLGVGEQSGNLETILNQVADYMEREADTSKKTKGAMMMPAITGIIALIVIGLMITFILPSFTDLYSSLGVELPGMVQFLVSVGIKSRSHGIYVLLGLFIIGLGIYFYVKTPAGKYRKDSLILKVPRLGRVKQLNELAHCCRSMALLFGSGLPLTEVMPLLIKSSNNSVLARALSKVNEDMIKGEGLYRPMNKNKIFMPMMVQMVRIGEETGNLDATLLSVARSYETEAEDKLRTLIGLIQPVMTIAIGGAVGGIAVTLMSAMTSMYGGEAL